MDSSDAKVSEEPSPEWKLPEVRDLTPQEKAKLDQMHGDVGRMFYGEKWPEVCERARRLNGGRG